MTWQMTSNWPLVWATWGPSPQMWSHSHPLFGSVPCLSSPSIFLPVRTTAKSRSIETEKCFCFNLLFFSSYCFIYLDFWSCHAACRIIVPCPWIKPVPPVLVAQSLNHWTTREVPIERCLCTSLLLSWLQPRFCSPHPILHPSGSPQGDALSSPKGICI